MLLLMLHFRYTAWAEGEPNDSGDGEDCAVLFDMYMGEQLERFCLSVYLFICLTCTWGNSWRGSVYQNAFKREMIFVLRPKWFDAPCEATDMSEVGFHPIHALCEAKI